MFRYDVQPNPRTNVFERKPVGESVDRKTIRATLFGAVLTKVSLPDLAMGQIAWEVALAAKKHTMTSACREALFRLILLLVSSWACVGSEVAREHTTIKPHKPKYWLTCALTIPASSVVKVK